MSNPNWYNPPPGGWGGQSPGQGREGDNQDGQQRPSFEDDDYEFIDDGGPRQRNMISVAEYEAPRRAVFQIQESDDPRGPPPEQQGSRRYGLAGAGQNYYANPTNQMFMVGPQGQAIGVTHGATIPGVPGVPGPPQQQAYGAPGAPGRPPQQQAPAIAVLQQPPGATAPPAAATQPPPQGAGAPTGVGGARVNFASPQEYSGIGSALDRLSHVMTDADTARSLKWQAGVNGDAATSEVFKVEVWSQPGFQFFALMQPGDPFLVVGHSVSVIYLTATDIASYHGKKVLFTGDKPIGASPRRYYEDGISTNGII